MESHYCYYNKKLRAFASSLRKKMTKAEVCLWKYALSSRKMKGYQFRRQRPVLNYVADFMCKELKLIVEVDGITHHSEEVFAKDEMKTTDLEKAGFVLIRFSDDEVLNDMRGVILTLEMTIDAIERNCSIDSTFTDHNEDQHINR